MQRCFLCETAFSIEAQPSYRNGRPYCLKCAAKYDAIADDFKHLMLPTVAWSSADIVALVALVFFFVGFVTGGLLSVVGFIMAFVVVDKTRRPFANIVLVTGIFILGLLLLAGAAFMVNGFFT